jgi:hypothetical protein
MGQHEPYWLLKDVGFPLERERARRGLYTGAEGHTGNEDVVDIERALSVKQHHN